MRLEVLEEVVLVLLRVDFLETEDVRRVGHHLLQDELLAVVPREGPRRRVPVHVARGVLFAEDVVAEEGERVVRGSELRGGRVGLDRDPVALWRGRGDGARVAEVGDESLGAVLFEELAHVVGQGVALDAQRVELVEGAQLRREARETIVEEEEILERGEEAQLGGEGGELVVGGVEEGEVGEFGERGRERRELVMGQVERGEERVHEQLGGQVLEMHAPHVQTRPEPQARVALARAGSEVGGAGVVMRRIPLPRDGRARELLLPVGTVKERVRLQLAQDAVPRLGRRGRRGGRGRVRVH